MPVPPLLVLGVGHQVAQERLARDCSRVADRAPAGQLAVELTGEVGCIGVIHGAIPAEHVGDAAPHQAQRQRQRRGGLLRRAAGGKEHQWRLAITQGHDQL
jgi:hypothetical protein